MNKDNNKIQQVEKVILSVADEIAEKDFNNTDISNALMFMDICNRYDIRHRGSEKLNDIFKSAKASGDVIQKTWKKLYNNN